jgi:transposase
MDKEEYEQLISKRYALLKSSLDERSKRLYLAAEAISIGWGGVSTVSRATGASPNTIVKGCNELERENPLPDGKIRALGGGRKKCIDKDQTLLNDLESLIEPSTLDDPESPLRWTSKSIRKISAELQNIGHKVSHSRVADILHMLGYSLQANKKTIEGSEHFDRDKQFEHIYEKCKEFQKEHQPVIYVDAKKKEAVGNFKNGGKELRPEKDPINVNVYDFVDKELGKVNPYGVYDITNNVGWVNVGIDHDTAAFAVESIRKWWYVMGCISYPDAKKILITADGGGSNGHRVRLWNNRATKTGR